MRQVYLNREHYSSREIEFRGLYHVTRDSQVFRLQVHKALFTLSPKTATVAEKGDCHRKQLENGDSRRIRRQSHFFCTATNGDSVDRF